MGRRPGRLALPENYGVERCLEQRKHKGSMAKLLTLLCGGRAACLAGKPEMKLKDSLPPLFTQNQFPDRRRLRGSSSLVFRFSAAWGYDCFSPFSSDDRTVQQSLASYTGTR
jgi:hypothetical protein